MMKPSTLVVAAIVAVLAAGAAAWWLTRDLSIDHTDRALVARGEPLYARHCAACHGARLEGQPDWQSRNAQGRLPAPPHDDTGHTWHHDDTVLFEVTKFGITRHAPPGYQSDMPAFGKTMTDDEIVAALAYIKSRWSPGVHEKRAAAGMD
ncbi:MAG: c-type cytochrome [Betaproteobacteria bacterium]